ncbi:MAG: iron ABC transporter permease [Bacteroidota bacterium]
MHITEYLLPGYVGNSLYLMCACSVLTICFGVSSAWLTVRYDFPGRGVLQLLLILPLAVPSYITAYAYAGVFDYGGFIQLVRAFFSVGASRIDLMNIHGLAFILSASLYPYVYVACRIYFAQRAQSLIDASAVLGGGERSLFFRLMLPLARPAIVGGVILVLMEVLNDYGAAKYFGVNTFTTGIFKAWFGYREPETALYLSAVMLLIIFLLIILEQKQRGKKRFTVESPANIKSSKLSPGKGGKLVAFACVFIPVLLGFFIPVSQLIYWAVLTFSSLSWNHLISVIGTSLGVACIAALFGVLVAFLLVVIKQFSHLNWVKQLAKVSILGYAIPGAVIAVGVYVPSLFIDKWMMRQMTEQYSYQIGLVLTGTVAALVYAYVVRFLAVAYNPLVASKEKILDGLLESSQSLGVSTFRTSLKVLFPLLKPAMIGAFLLVFIDVMKELPLTLILKPYYVQTLAIEAYQYASDERIMESAMPALLIVIVGLIPVFFLNRLMLKS